MTLRTSEAAESCSNAASSRSRSSSAIFVLEVVALVLEGLRRPLTSGAPERLSVVAFGRRALVGLPPALERRRIASPMAQDKASYTLKLAQREWPRGDFQHSLSGGCATSGRLGSVLSPRFASGLIYCC